MNMNIYEYCGEPGGGAQAKLPRRWIPRLRLGEVIEGVYFPVQVLSSIGAWHGAHLQPIRQIGWDMKREGRAAGEGGD